ncbi:hypothetical protein NK942_24405, partial [Salmonella enterica subsp. enterica serovar Typhimurium]|nr:hypothetical protein [Salmonella enterica subsp. enterica serovar Typhimurium]
GAGKKPLPALNSAVRTLSNRHRAIARGASTTAAEQPGTGGAAARDGVTTETTAMFNWVKTFMLMAAITALFIVIGGMIGGRSG